MNDTSIPPVAKDTLSGVDSGVVDLYARSAIRYDRLNALASFGTSNWYRRRTILSLDLKPDARVVDVGCGTGALALAAQRYLPESPSVVAVDPCPEMRTLARQGGVRDVRAGALEDIPMDEDSCDAVVSGYAIRYAQDIDAALVEMRRVLVPGGRMVLLEMIAPRGALGRRAGGMFVHRIGAPMLGLICGGNSVRELMRHFWESISSFGSPEEIVDRMNTAGFAKVEYRPAGGLLGEFRAENPSA